MCEESSAKKPQVWQYYMCMPVFTTMAEKMEEMGNAGGPPQAEN